MHLAKAFVGCNHPDGETHSPRAGTWSRTIRGTFSAPPPFSEPIAAILQSRGTPAWGACLKAKTIPYASGFPKRRLFAQIGLRNMFVSDEINRQRSIDDMPAMQTFTQVFLFCRRTHYLRFLLRHYVRRTFCADTLVALRFRRASTTARDAHACAQIFALSSQTDLR